MGNNHNLLLMPRLCAWTHIAHDADNLLQRRRRRAHAEYCLNLEPNLVGGEVAVAGDNDKSMDVTLQECLVPVWVTVELLRVAEVCHCVHFLPKLERVYYAGRWVHRAQGAVVDSELSPQIK